MAEVDLKDTRREILVRKLSCCLASSGQGSLSGCQEPWLLLLRTWARAGRRSWSRAGVAGRVRHSQGGADGDVHRRWKRVRLQVVFPVAFQNN